MSRRLSDPFPVDRKSQEIFSYWDFDVFSSPIRLDLVFPSKRIGKFISNWFERHTEHVGSSICAQRANLLVVWIVVDRVVSACCESRRCHEHHKDAAKTTTASAVTNSAARQHRGAVRTKAAKTIVRSGVRSAAISKRRFSRKTPRNHALPAACRLICVKRFLKKIVQK
jgi:hypothetical protein